MAPMARLQLHCFHNFVNKAVHNPRFNFHNNHMDLLRKPLARIHLQCQDTDGTQDFKFKWDMRTMDH